MSEKQIAVTPELIGLPQNMADAISVIQEFCRGRATGCVGCPLFAGMPGESGCVYQNFVPAEVTVQKVVDMNSYNIAAPTDGLPAVGTDVRLGEFRYIVLDYVGDNVILLHYDFVRLMKFGDEADYETSAIRRYLNEDYYAMLAEIVGKENIIKHRVDVTPLNGITDCAFVEDYISLMTVDGYRKYSKYIRADGWWWTATRKGVDGYSDYYQDVCTVCGCDICSEDCDDVDGGVRPFCILRSCVLATSR